MAASDGESQEITAQDVGEMPQQLLPEQPQSGRALAPWESAPGEEAIRSTLDPRDALVAINDTLEITELRDKPAKIVHVTVHSASLRDQATGEVKVLRRIVLTDDKGVNYACVSDGVIASIQQIAGVYGSPPWKEEPIKLKMIERQTRAGFRVYRLIPA